MRSNNNARGIIIKNGKVALMHRKRDGVEYFTTPGGGVEEGESLEEALIREIKEEMGLKVLNYRLAFDEEWNNTHFYYYYCECEGEELCLSGPEANSSPDNWFNPEWVDLKDTNKINMLLPERVRKYLIK